MSEGNTITLSAALISGMPSNSRPVDVNNDGRADLVGFENANASVVSLSQGSSSLSFGTKQTWSVSVQQSDNPAPLTVPWFKPLYLPGTSSGAFVVDHAYRYRETIEAATSVRDSIEFEPYYGVKKGVEGTRISASGNAWDQATFLASKLSSITQSQFLVGRVEFPESDYSAVNNWLDVDQISQASALLDKAGLRPNFSGTSPDQKLSVDHAWLRVMLPGASELSWQNVDPSWKQYSALSGNSEFVTSNVPGHLQDFLSPIVQSRTYDFDTDGRIPTSFTVLSGGINTPIVNSISGVPLWPLLSNGTFDFKLVTSQSVPTVVAVSPKAADGQLSLDVYSIKNSSGTPQSIFRVFARSSAEYEVGIEVRPAVSANAEPSVKLYERRGSVIDNLAADSVSVNPLKTFNGLHPGIGAGRVMLNVTDKAIEAQVGTRKFTFTLPAGASGADELNQGVFGFATFGPFDQFVDSITIVSKSLVTGSFGESLLRKSILTPESLPGSLPHTVSNQRSLVPTDDVAVVPYTISSSSARTTWHATDQHRVILELTNSLGQSQSVTLAVADVATKQLWIQQNSLAQLQLWVRDESAPRISIASTGPRATLKVTHVEPLLVDVPTPVQQFSVNTAGITTLTLNAGQFSDSHSLDALESLNTLYSGFPASLATLSADQKQKTAKAVQWYAATRFLAESVEVLKRNQRLFAIRLAMPAVTAGIVSSSIDINTNEALEFLAVPKRLLLDQPAPESLYLYVGSATAESGRALKNLNTLLVSDLSALEGSLISEITAAHSVSASTYLQVAKLQGRALMRLSLEAPGSQIIDDEWSSWRGTGIGAINVLLSAYPQNIRDAIGNAVLQGATVTIASAGVLNAGWPAGAYLQERVHGSSSDQLQVLSVLFDSAGKIINGGLSTDNSAEAPFLARLESEPDVFSGRVIHAETDFVIRAPGFEIPFTRTWRSPLESDEDRNNFGRGWWTAFDQYLELSTVPFSSTVVRRSSAQQASATFINTDAYVPNLARVGRAMEILWHREDGSSVLLGLESPDSIFYSNATDVPRIRIERSSENIYVVVYADGRRLVFENKVVDRMATDGIFTGHAAAVLTKIVDRFGNILEVVRKNTAPFEIERIDYKNLGNAHPLRTLLNAHYTEQEGKKRLDEIVVKSADVLIADRSWTYRYAATRLESVDGPESVRGITPLSRYTYEKRGRQALSGQQYLLKSVDLTEREIAFAEQKRPTSRISHAAGIIATV